MLKQKPNQFVFPMIFILILALLVLGILLTRMISSVIIYTTDDTVAVATNCTLVAEPFDYTRDRDQYWYPALPIAQAFDYTRDRDQYETTYATSVTAFDYTRDRDQYWYPAMPIEEAFDYTRDRDQYWRLNS